MILIKKQGNGRWWEQIIIPIYLQVRKLKYRDFSQSHSSEGPIASNLQSRNSTASLFSAKTVSWVERAVSGSCG